MDKKTFESLHKAQLEIMDEIHRVCVQEGITYSLLYGSVLGAIRHKGFIPWDCDIDCGMLRPDYERFARICKEGKVLNPRFVYYDSKNVYGNIHTHPVLSIKGTTLTVRSMKYNNDTFNYGIYLDIFPIDSAPDTEAKLLKHSKALETIRRKIYIKRHYNYSKSKVIKTLKWIRSFRYITKNWDTLFNELETESRRYEACNTHSVFQGYTYYYHDKYCGALPKEWFEHPDLVKFEDRQFYIPHESDQYLKALYGDYMTPPPEEKRMLTLNYFDSVIFDKEY